jgi:hypothetical protein
MILLHYLSLAYASLGVKAKQYEINLANATSSQQKIPIHLSGSQNICLHQNNFDSCPKGPIVFWIPLL